MNKRGRERGNSRSTRVSCNYISLWRVSIKRVKWNECKVTGEQEVDTMAVQIASQQITLALIMHKLWACECDNRCCNKSKSSAPREKHLLQERRKEQDAKKEKPRRDDARKLLKSVAQFARVAIRTNRIVGLSEAVDCHAISPAEKVKERRREEETSKDERFKENNALSASDEWLVREKTCRAANCIRIKV